MIHGTWGWKGDWWRPRSSFHDFILHNHRPKLVQPWCQVQLERSALTIPRTARSNAFRRLAVFAHSYGGEVAARAVLCGAPISELVLLSTPVTPWVEMALPYTPRVVDVRLRFDPVLGIAQTQQRIMSPGPNTTTVLFGRWRYSHGATHEESVWHDEDIARRGRL